MRDSADPRLLQIEQHHDAERHPDLSVGNGQLGYSVALTGDGSALLAGAPGEPVPPNAPPGRAYVFGAASGGWADATAPNATLGPADATANDSFGTSVALSSDGGALAVGGPGGAGDDEMTPGEADVFEARTLTAPTCQPTAVGVGQRTTCTATVTDYGHRGGDADGTSASATDSAGSFGAAASCTLSEDSAGTSSCQVTYTPSAAGSGSHTVTASYSGDDEHAPGIGAGGGRDQPGDDQHVGFVQPRAGGGRSDRQLRGDRAAADASAGPPAGTVTMSSNGAATFNPGGCTLSGGSGAAASCTFSYTPSQVGPGTHQLTAAYAGDGGHAASQGSDPLGVGDAGTGAPLELRPALGHRGHTARCTVTARTRARARRPDRHGHAHQAAAHSATAVPARWRRTARRRRRLYVRLRPASPPQRRRRASQRTTPATPTTSAPRRARCCRSRRPGPRQCAVVATVTTAGSGFAQLPEDRGVLPRHGHGDGGIGDARRRQRPDRRRPAGNARRWRRSGQRCSD